MNSIVAVALLVACSGEPPPTPTATAAVTPKTTAATTPSASASPKPDGAKAAGKPTVGDAPLHNGQPSLEALGTAVVAALAANDGRGLNALSIPQKEFEQRLFGLLVTDPTAQRPGPGPVWKARSRENLSQMSAVLAEHGGKGYAFVSLESTAHEARAGIVLHRNPRLVVKDGEGERELPILGEVLEHPASGTFVISSFTH